MNGQELGDSITDAVNSGIDPNELQDTLKRSHNTLQRYAFHEVFKPGIIALAGAPYVDARNENAVGTAQEICDKMGWEYETHNE